MGGMRYITTHKSNPANKDLFITALDAPGSGGAHHLYMIEGFNTASNPACPLTDRHGKPVGPTTILFQNGPIKEVGVNGVTHEALLAILIDRLSMFNKGPYACRENSLALTKLEEALMWLNHRTRAREERGVEGTHTV